MKIKEIETISKRLSLLIVILREENRMKEKEEQRLIQLKAIEEEIHNSGVEYICGIDEAGRGPLAGPVVIAAAIMPRNSMIEGVNDSKKVSEKKREELYEIITKEAISYGVGIIDQKEIDRIKKILGGI